MGEIKNIPAHLKQNYLWFLDVPGCFLHPPFLHSDGPISLSSVSVYERLRTRLNVGLCRPTLMIPQGMIHRMKISPTIFGETVVAFYYLFMVDDN